MTLVEVRDGHLEELGLCSDPVLGTLEGLEVSWSVDTGSM